MESGERLASSSPSQPSIRSTAPPPEPSSNLNSKSGHLFQLMADPGFGLSSSFPMLNHPAFRLYSSLSGGSHFGGLGTLGMPGAITPHPHPQLGPFPDWWRTADAQAHAAAALFPPVLGLPPLFTPPALNRSHSTSTKGLNGSANGKANSASSGASSASSSPSPAFTAAEQSRIRKSALKTPNNSQKPNTGLNTPKSASRTPNCNWETKNKKERVQEKESQYKQKNLCTTEICSNTDSQSGSSSDSETLSSLDSGDLENEVDEDEDEEGGESESEREQRVKKVQLNSCVSSTHPLFTSTPRQEHGKHPGVFLTTGPRGKPKPSRDSKAPSKPLCLTLSPKLLSLSSSPKPRSLSSCPRPSSLKTSSRSSSDEHLTQDAFRPAFPTQLLEHRHAAKSSQKANHHSNLFLSSSNGPEQDAPLALITKPRSRPSRPTANPSLAECFNAPINLSAAAKSSELYSDQSTSRPMHGGAESDLQSSKDSEDSAEDEDDAEEDEKDDSLSDSSSNLDTDSDDDSDDAEGNDEELNTDPESPGAPALRKLTKSPVKVQNAPAQPPVTSSTLSASFILTPPTGSGKRRRVTDEQALRRPLQYGWQRETRIRNVSGRVQGEVAYYGPCGKKLKQYPDVIKYLARNGISEITRDNFSFSTKIRVGDFYEAREGPEGSQWCLLKEDEVLVKVSALERQRGRAQRADGHHRKRKSTSASGASDAKVLRRTEAQETAWQATQMKLMRKLEKQALARTAKEAKRQQALLVAEEKRKQKEQLKILKQQERMRRVEQIRMEKELRAQQILEAKRKKKEEAANAKLLEAEKRIKEKELRRQQAILLKHQERERRRQHTMLVKAVEARKKAEERERIKQEKRDEKRLNKERKLELRRLELELEKELNRPNEDMCLIDQQALPHLSRVPGLLLPASCLADCLMVMQFLRCFGKVLRLDVAPPTLNMLQAGLLNLNPGAGQLQDLLIRLLSAAVCDPGLPPGQRAKTALGEHISSVDINRENVSEILQIFMAAHCVHTELSALAESLRTKPFQAHTPSQKASVLAFMVNELACSKSVVTEIDKNIEHMANQRREKWVVERNLRKLRSIHTKRTGKPDCTAGAEAVGTPTAGRKRKKKADSEDDDEEDDDSDEGELDEEEDEEGGKKGKKADEEDEDQTASVEELEKQIEKLTKQQLQIRRKLFESSHSLRSMMLGQDRYKRRYWVLPQCGGVFVESMESGEGPQEVERERERLQNPVKDEPTEVPLHKPFGPGSPGTSEADPQQEKDSLNLFLQKPDSFSKLSQLLDVVKTSPSAPLSTPNTPEAPLLFTCKQDGKSDLALSPAASALGGRRFHSEQLQLYGALSERNAHWFSLLPRSPCDHGSLTTIKTKASSGTSSNPALQIKPDVHLTTLLFSHQQTGSVSPNRVCADPSTSASVKTKSPGPPEEKKIRNRDLMTPNPIPQDMLTGWWKVSSSEELSSIMKACHPRGIRERVLQKQIQKHTDYLLQTCAKNRDASVIDVSELKHSGVCEGTVQRWSVEDRTMALDVAVLQQVEQLVHKVTCASLHIKSWKPPEPKSEREDLLYYEHKATNDGENETKPKSIWEVVRRANNPLDIAVEQLWDLEQNIERRYLKSPLNGTLQISVDNLGTVRVPATAPTTGAEGNGGEEDVAPGMRQWRKALSEVRSGAQLSLCLQQLQRSIAWERSIMKVYCQICHKGDNEDLLLLCDGCDKGCHTYCHKPQISSIPEGDWFCPACRATACLSPLKVKKQAVEKPPETKPNTTPCGTGEGSEEDTASSGTSSTSKKRGKGTNKRKKEERVNADAPLQEAPPRAKKAKTARDNNKDLELCRFLLAELQSHQDAWPFMSPVNPKSVPGYRKVIKKPMDFSTIREKLSNSQYLNLEMFIIDVNLVFENCEMFNEDDSDIGRAGHSMRRFFQRRWTELLKQIH